MNYSDIIQSESQHSLKLSPLKKLGSVLIFENLINQNNKHKRIERSSYKSNHSRLRIKKVPMKSKNHIYLHFKFQHLLSLQQLLGILLDLLFQMLMEKFGIISVIVQMTHHHQ